MLNSTFSTLARKLVPPGGYFTKFSVKGRERDGKMDPIGSKVLDK